MINKNSVSVGNAGEYFVAGELERHGFSVAVPMSNTELFDILAFNRNTMKQYAIQVKTTYSSKKEWVLSVKNETINKENIFYVFVCMNNLETPEYHIVPSAVVSYEITQSHKNWLNTPSKNGKSHKDNPMRKFSDYENKYLNKWELLF